MRRRRRLRPSRRATTSSAPHHRRPDRVSPVAREVGRPHRRVYRQHRDRRSLKGYAYMTHFDPRCITWRWCMAASATTARTCRRGCIAPTSSADVFGGSSSVPKVLHHFQREGRGVLVFLRDGSVGVPVSAIPKNGETKSDGGSGGRAPAPSGARSSSARRSSRTLGISSIRLLITAAKHRYVGLAGFGIRDRGDRADRRRLSRSLKSLLLSQLALFCSNCPG